MTHITQWSSTNTNTATGSCLIDFPPANEGTGVRGLTRGMATIPKVTMSY